MFGCFQHSTNLVTGVCVISSGCFDTKGVCFFVWINGCFQHSTNLETGVCVISLGCLDVWMSGCFDLPGELSRRSLRGMF